MTTSFPGAALLLLGHGSTLNADSAAPTYQHAEELRRRGIFAEVHVAFWKEEPNFRQALRQTSCREVYVVPNFISSGYFTEQIIPRELGLTGPVTLIGNQVVRYCAPVGLHPSMTEALLRSASRVVEASPERIAEPAKTACLFICGHGTSFNDNSTKIIHEQAEIIRKRGLFADCQGVLMEQKPFVKDWRTLTDCPDVIVVPFFISDGLHSYEDIPVLLGLTHNIKEKSFENPHREGERRLWYSTAIGTEAALADVIIAQVAQARDEQGEVALPPKTDLDLREEWELYFSLNAPPWTMGELSFRPGPDGGFELMDTRDLVTDRADLEPMTTLEEIKEMIRWDRYGEFRPLRAAPDLPRGWIQSFPNWASLMLALDYIYPAELANAALWNKDQLPITSWKETAERQTGRFRIVREIDDADIRELTARYCQEGCLKYKLWSPVAEAVELGPGEIPLLCPEACNFLVGKAREKLKRPGEE